MYKIISNPFMIKPVLIYPNGHGLPLVPESRLISAISLVQDWWHILTGRWIPLAILSTVRAKHSLEAFGDISSSPMSLATQVIAEQMKWPFNEQWAYLCFVRGAGGYAGTIDKPPAYRIVLGDIFLEAIMGNQVEAARIMGDRSALEPALSREGQCGTLGHELGHLILETGGDEHPDINTKSIMSGYWAMFPNVTLTGDEMISAQESRFLS